MTFQAKPWLYNPYFQLCHGNKKDRLLLNLHKNIAMKIKILNNSFWILEESDTKNKKLLTNVLFQFTKAESIRLLV